MRVTTLLTDLDNTLYDWVAFFAPSFRAMVHALARELTVEEDVLYADFKDVYMRVGTLEFQHAVQNLKLVEGVTPLRLSRLVHIATVAFARARKRNLLPYPGVAETLNHFKTCHTSIIGVTNAPLGRGVGRLKHLGLWRYFDGLVGWSDDVAGDWPGAPRSRESRPQTRRAIIVGLPKKRLKPQPDPYLMALEAVAGKAEECVVVGDSLEKDVVPALTIGAFGVWARYGQATEKSAFETVLRVTDWDQERIAMTYHERSAEPSMTIDAFGELKGLVDTSQLSLFSA